MTAGSSLATAFVRVQADMSTFQTEIESGTAEIGDTIATGIQSGVEKGGTELGALTEKVVSVGEEAGAKIGDGIAAGVEQGAVKADEALAHLKDSLAQTGEAASASAAEANAASVKQVEAIRATIAAQQELQETYVAGSDLMAVSTKAVTDAQAKLQVALGETAVESDKASSGIGGMGKLLSGGLIAAIGGTVLGKLASGAANTAENMMKLQTVMGLNAEQAQRFSIEAAGAGESTQKLTVMAGRLDKQLASASAGTAGAAKAIDTLGINAETFARSNMDQKAQLIAQSLNKTSLSAKQLTPLLKTLNIPYTALQGAKSYGDQLSVIQKGLGETASTGSSFTRMLQQNGIDLQKFQAENFPDQLSTIAKAYENAATPAQGLSLVMAAFGRQGVQLLPMIQNLAMLKKTADDFHMPVINEDDAEKAGMQFKEIDQYVQFLGQDLAVKLVPALTNAAEEFIKIATPIVEFVKNSTAAQAVIAAVVGAFVAMEALDIAEDIFGPIINVIKNLITLIPGVTSEMVGLDTAMDANPIGLVVAALGALVAGLVVLYEKVPAVRNAINDAFTAIQSTVSTVVTYLESLWARWGDQITQDAEITWAFVKITIADAVKDIQTVVTVTVNTLEALWQKFGGSIESIAKASWDAIKTEVTTAVTVVEDVVKTAVDLIEGHWGAAWSAIENLASTAMSGVVRLLEDDVKILEAAGGMLISALEAGFKAGLSALDGLAKSALAAIIEPFTHLPSWLGGDWARSMESSLTGAMNGLVNTAGAEGTDAGNAWGSGLITATNAAIDALNAANKNIKVTSYAGPGEAAGAGNSAALAHAVGYGQTLQHVADVVTKAKTTIEGGGAPISLPGLAAKGGSGGDLSASGVASLLQRIKTLQTTIGNIFPQSLQDKLTKEAQKLTDSIHKGLDPTATDKIRADVTALSKEVADGVKLDKAEANAKTSVAAIKKELSGFDPSFRATMATQLAAISSQFANVVSDKDLTAAKTKLASFKKTVTDALRFQASDTKGLDTLGRDIKNELDGKVTPEITAGMEKVRDAIGTVVTAKQQQAVQTQMTNLKEDIHKQQVAIHDEVSLENTFDGLKRQADKLKEDATPGIQSAMAEIQKEISEPVTPATEEKIKNQIANVKTAITTELDKVKTAITNEKSAFSNAFSELVAPIDKDFEAATAKAITNLQTTVTGAFDSFQYGGSAGIITPAQAALNTLQDAHDSAQQTAQLSADQAQLAIDQAAGDAATILSDQQAVAEDQYQIQVSALTKTADAENTAADTQLTAAQTAYQNQQDALEDAMNQRLSALETGLENGNISAQDGMTQLDAILTDPQYGIDANASAYALGGQIYTGLNDGLTPVFDLLTQLQSDMAKAGQLASSVTSTSTPAGGGAPAISTSTNTAVPTLAGLGLDPGQIKTIITEPIVDALTTQTKAIKDSATATSVTINSTASHAAQTARDALR